jgi:hypothetical protein
VRRGGQRAPIDVIDEHHRRQQQHHGPRRARRLRRYIRRTQCA